MLLHEALHIAPDEPACISLIGGGGKTTAMFRLARELKGLGKKVLVTTTTNIAEPQQGQCDVLMLEGCPDTALFSTVRPGTIVCLGGGLKNAGEVTKVQSVDPAYIDDLWNNRLFDFILVEADGAKRKPIKAPAEYEPVIPSSTTLVIGVIGLDCLGKAIAEEHIHRCELFCAITGKKPGELIDRESIVRLIMAENGIFKSAPAAGRKVVVLNKADTEALIQQGGQIAQELDRLAAPVHGCVVASLQKENYLTARFA